MEKSILKKSPGWFRTLNKILGSLYFVENSIKLDKDDLIKAARKATGIERVQECAVVKTIDGEAGCILIRKSPTDIIMGAYIIYPSSSGRDFEALAQCLV